MIVVQYSSELEDHVDESTLSKEELVGGCRYHTLSLPSKKEVCSDCEGEGYVLNPSMRNHAYTMEEFNETFHDEEDREQYFKRGGIYDVVCPTCKGKNVVDVVDEAAIPSTQKEEYQKYLKEQQKKDEDDRLYRLICESERRFGC